METLFTSIRWFLGKNNTLIHPRPLQVYISSYIVVVPFNHQSKRPSHSYFKYYLFPYRIFPATTP
jgi:hypothetical protein